MRKRIEVRKRSAWAILLLLIPLFLTGCNALWFVGGAATGAVVHEALDEDEKVVIVEKEKN